MNRQCVSAEVGALLQSAYALETEKTDGQLLSQFLSRRDEAAFAALVRRHGPMVLGTCRRLGNSVDAEDAFQATFLVLVHKAASLTGYTSLGNWLYGVARRTALNTKRASLRRQAREKVAARPEAVAEDHRAPESMSFVDEVLSGLPAKYRLPLILCDLEGRTRKEAANQLGLPEGTVAGQLRRGRSILARRLLQRKGDLLSGVVSGTVLARLSEAALPEQMVQTAVQKGMLAITAERAVHAVLVSNAQSLAADVLRGMHWSKLKIRTMILLGTLAMVGVGAWIFSGHADPAQPLSVVEKPLPPTPPHRDQATKEAVPPRPKGGVGTFANPFANTPMPRQPDLPTAQDYFARAQNYLYRGLRAEAYADFSKAIELDPRFMDAYIGRASVFTNATPDYLHQQSMGAKPSFRPDYARAIVCLDQGLAVDPEHVSSLNYRIHCCKSSGRFDEAIADCSRIIAILSKNVVPPKGVNLVNMYFQRAQLYKDTKRDYNSAAADYTKIVESNPNPDTRYKALSLRSLAYVELREYGKADSDFVAALGEKPERDLELLHPWLWQLATCPDARYRNGPKALEYAQRVFARTKSHPQAEVLAAAYAECGQFQEAVRCQKQAMEDFAIRLREKRTNLPSEHHQAMQARLRLYESGKPNRTD